MLIASTTTRKAVATRPPCLESTTTVPLRGCGLRAGLWVEAGARLGDRRGDGGGGGPAVGAFLAVVLRITPQHAEGAGAHVPRLRWLMSYRCPRSLVVVVVVGHARIYVVVAVPRERALAPAAPAHALELLLRERVALLLGERKQLLGGLAGPGLLDLLRVSLLRSISLSFLASLRTMYATGAR